MKAPVAKKIAKSLIKHNDERIDHYFWMNDREDPEVIKHLNQENKYCKSKLAHTEQLQDNIYKEIVGRIKPNDDSTPYLNNGYYYQSRYFKGNDHPIYYRRQKDSKKWNVLIDAQERSKEHDYFKVGSIQASPNNKYVAYSTDIQGRRLYTIRIMNLDSNLELEDELVFTTGSVAWADNNTFFYTKKDSKTLRSFQIWKHTLGDKNDQLVFEEKDDTYYTFVYRSKTGQFVIIGSQSTISSEYHLIPTSEPNSSPRLFQLREDHHEYDIYDGGHEFIIRTNWEATNFKVMSCGVNVTSKNNWIEKIAHDPEIFIEDIEVLKDWACILSRSNAIPDISIFDRAFSNSEKLEIDEQARMLYFSQNYEYENQKVRIGFCSLTVPFTTYDYDPSNKLLELLKRQEILGGYNPTDYSSFRINIKGLDGAEIPVSYVYKNSLFIQGTNPCLLYGYGSYGHSIDPYFSIPRISLLERGFVFAIAHIRGGQELGRPWYDQGKMLEKQNTFNDFIAAGTSLIERNVCAKDKLCAMGGSAGGLLIGAIINQKPELWKAVVSAVPFVDVVTTMLDDTIPLTTGEYNEWGNPNEEKYYRYIKEYSPYDNVAKQDYPSILVTTGYHDSQVQYWEPAKWVAKLREHNTSSNPMVFFINMEAGHSGKAGRYETHKETALEWAFLIDQTKTKA